MSHDMQDSEYLNQRQLTIGEMLSRRARIHPEREALVFEDRRLSYLEFDQRTNRLADAMRGRGIEKGDKVAQLLFNCNEILECYFAASKLGAVNVPLNFRLKGAEILYQLQDGEAKLLVFGEDFAPMVEELKGKIPGVGLICVGAAVPAFAEPYEGFLARGEPGSTGVVVLDDDPAFIMYTSGTTGKPKGAVLTHKNVMMNTINCTIELFQIQSEIPDERWLFVAPFFHTAASALTQICLFRGGTACILKAFDPQAVIEKIQDERITCIFLPPVMSTFLLSAVDVGKYDTSSLCLYGSGASILPTQTRKQINQAFPGAKLFDGFGQTEMSPVTCMLKPNDAERKTASVGKPIVNVEVRIVDGGDRDVPPGEVGEIVYRGPTTMKEYYRNPEATAEALRGGWFHSGDMVRMDEEGFIYVVDRKKDVIISGGENIYPVEIEEVLYQNPKILEAAVIGVHDETWGEAVMAVVVPKPGEELNSEEVIDWCAERLAGYKKPRHVDFAEALPRNAAMKVLKTELRDQHGKSIRYD